MHSNLFLKITSYDATKRFLESDNVNSYFTVSDFKNQTDGLFYKGHKLFSSIKPANDKSNIIFKQLSPLWININFTSNELIKYLLLKNGEGMLLLIKNKKLFSFKNRKFSLSLKIEQPFEILEKNLNKIIIKYPINNESYESLYCGILAINNNFFENIQVLENNIVFQIKPDLKDANIKLYFFYNSHYDDLIKQLESNSGNIETLKKKHLKNSLLPFKYTKFDIENKFYNKALSMAVISSSSFIMKSTENIGIWAGYPYFLNNWGRDTFISLSGICLTSGRYEESIHILENFAYHQCKLKKTNDYGKIPNIIFENNKVYYNSSDATPLFIRSVYEYFLYTGNSEALVSLWDTIKLAIDYCYLSKKDQNNFILQNDADDWMDAKKEGKYSYSPRGGYPVELQSLWYTALTAASIIAQEILNNKFLLPEKIKITELKKYKNICLDESIKLKKSFNDFFIGKDGDILNDHLNTDYSIDDSIRPNALLAIFYPNLPGIPQLLDKTIIIKIIKKLLSELIYKYGVSSLSKNDQKFHPVHISDMYNKDAAYHNGVIWNWLSGAFVSIMCSLGLQDFAFLHTEELCKQINSLGTLGELSNPSLNEKDHVISSGAFSQAWSVSEFCRNFYQDYMGIKMNVQGRTLYFQPSIPIDMGTIKTSIRFGLHENILINSRTDKNIQNVSYIEIKGLKIIKPLKIIIKIRLGNEEKGGKFIYRYLYMKVFFKNNNDSIRLSFAKQENKLIKLKDINTLGQCELQFLRKGFKVFDEKIESNLYYTSPITFEQAKSFQSMKEKDFLENNFMMK